MATTINNPAMEIHIAIANAKISGIVTGTTYNPDIYNDLMANMMKAFDQAISIATKHGYDFPADDDDEDTLDFDEEDNDGDN